MRSSPRRSALPVLGTGLNSEGFAGRKYNILVRTNEKAVGSARALLLALIEQNHTLLISGNMLVELAGVLRYPRLKALYQLTEKQIYDYIQFLREVCDSVVPTPFVRAPMRDANDVAVLQTAIVGEAEVICTLDSDFFAPETQAFLSAWH